MMNCCRQLQRHHRLLARRQFERIQRHLVGKRRERFLVEIDARAPEHLLVIFPERQRVGIMRGDAPDARADGEGDLDLLVDRGLIAAGAQPAMIVVWRSDFSVQWASSTPPQPGHSTFQVRSNSPSREACRKPEITRSSSSPVRFEKSSTLMRLSSWSSPLLDQLQDGIGHRRIGGLLQHGKLGLDVAHGATSRRARRASMRRFRHRGVMRKHRRAIGLRRHHADRHHRLLVDQVDTERADHLGQRQRRLDQREMRADADPRADAERQIGKAIGRRCRRHEARAG